MSRFRFPKDLAIGCVFFAVYLVAAKLSLRLAYIHPSASAVWPPAGIAWFSLVVHGHPDYTMRWVDDWHSRIQPTACSQIPHESDATVHWPYTAKWRT